MNALHEEELENIEEQKQGFSITDIDSLNWAFRKISALKAQQRKITKLADAERERIDQWEEKELRDINNSLQFFETHISKYHANQLAENPKAKTISTPYGKTKARSSSEQIDKVNEDTLLKHVQASNLNDYIKPTLMWGEWKKSLKIVDINGKRVVVDELGQKVEGISIKQADTKFSVEVE
ncbi:host-nuclease inhibitor Gam family protein [Cytobacillus sp. IB215665]|uniref:host-nuclease inhibitor Gam family protein n=1 Tax=Cytobacillus sp. IB215665 TaxID=3097357 RepID=UPI002A0BBB2F|nr:host-nuclease inhibitor Gam family protein [Cytobacillus sp. IB215665]MDX8367894.1 host-nuclease inhibitor Gam family protein [Cytobacillus sp. IB215665]